MGAQRVSFVQISVGIPRDSLKAKTPKQSNSFGDF